MLLRLLQKFIVVVIPVTHVTTTVTKIYRDEEEDEEEEEEGGYQKLSLNHLKGREVVPLRLLYGIKNFG